MNELAKILKTSIVDADTEATVVEPDRALTRQRLRSFLLGYLVLALIIPALIAGGIKGTEMLQQGMEERRLAAIEAQRQEQLRIEEEKRRKFDQAWQIFSQVQIDYNLAVRDYRAQIQKLRRTETKALQLEVSFEQQNLTDWKPSVIQPDHQNTVADLQASQEKLEKEREFIIANIEDLTFYINQLEDQITVKEELIQEQERAAAEAQRLAELEARQQAAATAAAEPEDSQPVEESAQEPPVPTYTFAVSTVPGAKIRILNIKPRYSPGMLLEYGSYHIEVTAEGFETRNLWHELREDIVLDVDLQPIELPEPTPAEIAAEEQADPAIKPEETQKEEKKEDGGLLDWFRNLGS